MSQWTEHVERQVALEANWPAPLQVGPNKRLVARIAGDGTIMVRSKEGAFITIDAADALELLDWLKTLLEPQ